MKKEFTESIILWSEFYDHVPFMLGSDDETGVSFVRFEKEFLNILNSEMKRELSREEISTFVNTTLPNMFLGDIE
jgi:hypothetical protein